jgi:hypothetical protein
VDRLDVAQQVEKLIDGLGCAAGAGPGSDVGDGGELLTVLDP